MSNIPNSAMPHAFTDDLDDDDDETTSANQRGFSLAGMAIAGAVTAVLYLLWRRK